MKTRFKIPNLQIASILALCCLPFMGHATPFASGITNSGGIISFILNQDADNVKVIFDGGGVGNTNDLGALGQGMQSFSLGAHTTYEIHVTKSTVVGWAKYSTNAVPKYNNYFSPGGLAINRNPADLARFGRIYVLENQGGDPAGTARGPITEGVYIVNADFSDALGRDDTASTGGISFETGAGTGGVRSPNKIEIGEDGFIYVADWSTNFGTVYQFDPDITNASGVVVLGAAGPSTPTVHTTINGSAIVKGSLAAGTLQVWAIDGAKLTGSQNFNQLYRWDINSGPLPYNGTPVGLATNSIRDVSDVQSDLDIAPDGKFFLCQNRAVTVGGYTNRGSVNIRVFDTDGVTELWNSHQQSTNVLGNATAADIFANARAIKVSPDNTKVALIINSTHVWIMDLTNGVPDISTRFDLNAFALASASTAHRREVAWDAAGNLYAANNSSELVVAWSPGGAKTAITRSSGTFQLVQPAATVSVTNFVPTVAEGAATGTFRFTRTGDTSGSLTVNYTVTGSAVAGADYSVLPGSFTYAPGQTTTNVLVSALNDADVELTETVIVTLAASGDYALGVPLSATVSILDTDNPELTITGVQTNMAESATGSTATFQITRKGLLSSSITANVSYSGGAVAGGDFTGPATITFVPGAVSTNLILSVVNDPAIEGVETFTVTIDPGAGYTIGTTNSQSGAVISEDLSPATVLFSDKFDSAGSAAAWVVNTSHLSPTNDVFFGFDYSTVGIPEAPSSAGTFSPTKGLKMVANNQSTGGVLSGLSVSPLDGNFTNDYRLRFDMWLNYQGPLNVGASGSTENLTAGVGVPGGETIWPGNTTLGPDAGPVWFTTSSDGDIASTTTGDYTVFIDKTQFNPGAAGITYLAGNTAAAKDNFDPYYSLWGSVTAPAAQIALFSEQTNTSRIGSIGMAWHCVTITKIDTTVTWTIDGYPVAIVDYSTLAPNFSTNVFVGYHDLFTGINSAATEFGLVDNLRVEQLAAPGITITGIQLINGGVDVQIDFTGAVADSIGSFTVQSSGTVDGIYGDVSSTITQLSPGNFQAVLGVNGQQQFYKIKRL